VAKQTGRECGVKSAVRAARFGITGLQILTAACLVSLAGCASTWMNPAKSPQEAKIDDRACSAEAEETALTRAAQQKVEYRKQSSIQPGLNRGETPMQMVDRTRTEDTYTRDFESCMRSKGYSRDKK